MNSLIDSIEVGFNRFLRFLISLVAASIGLFAIFIPINLLLIKQQWGALWWLNESIEYALYVGVFIGAPWVLQQGAHVRVDVFVSLLPHRAAVQMERVLDLLGALLCTILCFYGTRATIMEFVDGTLPDKDLRIANWYMLAFFALSFLLLTLEFLFRLRRAGAIVDEEAANPTKAAF
ncbi:MAG: TRAP transporter small permease subunit [Rhodobacteraceae bacterium]|nr:TRAP transporter small permease subunit [Paracoccaceae bacterium]